MKVTKNDVNTEQKEQAVYGAGRTENWYSQCEFFEYVGPQEDRKLQYNLGTPSLGIF